MTLAYEELILKFSALSEEVRLKILFHLSREQKPLTTNELATLVGVRPSVASHHLTVLSKASMVVKGQHGRFVLHVPNPQTFIDLSRTLIAYSGDLNAKVIGSKTHPDEGHSLRQAGERQERPVGDPRGAPTTL